MLQSFKKSVNWDNVLNYNKYLYNQHTNVELEALLANNENIMANKKYNIVANIIGAKFVSTDQRKF